MANTKISALTALTGANLATNDQFAVVDTSAVATKSITVAELKLGIMPAPGPIGATTPSTGAFTTLSATGQISETANESSVRLNSTGTNGVIWDIYSGGNSTISGGFFVVRNGTAGINKLLISADAAQTSISSTGLAVTGTISATSIITPGTFTTGTRPAKTLGGIIFDTTLNKLLIGGVSAWEVVTSI
jgi:hypothetical protein